MFYRLKKLIPQPVLGLYHFALAKISAGVYRHPSNKLIVIGVTGTNGKSSTVQFIAKLLTELGETVGYTTTAGFNIAGKDIANKMKMTMPGRFYLQSLIGQMLDAKCTYAVIETSSQGIEQFRHLGINYDEVVFTNLTPEHIEAHGGFANYKKAKGKLFAHLTSMPKKIIGGKVVDKVSVINADDKHADYFIDFAADRHIQFSWSGEKSEDRVVAKYKKLALDGVKIEVWGEEAALQLRAEFEHKNALAAMSAVYGLGFGTQKIVKAAEALQNIPGRFEIIDSGQPFLVVVDYAYEPYAIEALLQSIKKYHPNKIIGVHGSSGGGRDVARRPKIGELAGKEEDFVVVTNEDPYDEDPRSIIEAVALGAVDVGKIEGQNLFLVDERMDGIEKAVSLAKEGDAVIITGKGNEPVMAVKNGKKIPWSDRDATKLALARLGFTND